MFVNWISKSSRMDIHWTRFNYRFLVTSRQFYFDKVTISFILIPIFTTYGKRFSRKLNFGLCRYYCKCAVHIITEWSIMYNLLNLFAKICLRYMIFCVTVLVIFLVKSVMKFYLYISVTNDFYFLNIISVNLKLSRVWIY